MVSIKEIGIILMFLLVLYNAQAPAPGDFQRYIPPGLLAHYQVLNLEKVAMSKLGLFNISYSRLTYFKFQNGLSSPFTIGTGEKSKFMQCGSSPTLPMAHTSYFCIDQMKRNILTTQSYHLEAKENETITLTMETKGNSSHGVKIIQHDIVINIRSRCSVQQHAYTELVDCQPSLMTLKYSKLNDKDIEFKVPDHFIDQTLKINSIEFMHMDFKGRLQIFDEKQILLHDTNINLTKSEESVLTETKLKRGTKKFIIKLQHKNYGYVRLQNGASIEVLYYSMTSFCGSASCFTKYYNWDWIREQIPKDQQTCVKDVKRLKDAFNSCYSPFIVNIVPSSSKIQYGDRLSLRCEYDTLLPHSVTWFRIRGDESLQLTSDSHFLNFTSLSFQNYVYYECQVTTVTGRYVQKSRSFLLKLRDVFTGQLNFVFNDIPYDERYQDSASTFYKTTKDKIKNKIVNLLQANDIRNTAQYSILPFTERNGKLAVRGTASVKRITVKLQNLSYLHWMNLVVMEIRNNKILESTTAYTVLRTYETCSNTTTIQNGKFKFNWEAAFVGQRRSLRCPGSEITFTSRRCSARQNNHAEWDAQDDTQCAYPNTAEDLEKMSKISITADNVIEVSDRFERTTLTITTSYEVSIAATILNKFVAFLSPKQKDVVNSVMNSVDNLLQMNEAILTESERMNGSSTRILQFLSNAGEQLAGNIAYGIKRKGFALNSLKIQRKNYEGLSIAANYKNSINSIDIVVNQSNVSYSYESRSSIILPPSLIKNLPESVSSISVVVSSFENDKLFTPKIPYNQKNTTKGKSAENQWNVNSQVISAEIHGQKMENLDEPVIMKFKVVNETKVDYDKACVYWDMRENVWSDSGCYLYDVDKQTNTFTCHCDHLTNFALLFNAVPLKGIHADILTIITYVGLAISLTGAFLTFLAHAIFPMVRSTTPPKILMNLCLALIMMTTLFLFGVERRTSHEGCKAIAIIIQYFVLCIFTWSAVEGFHSARSLVFPMKIEIGRFIQKASLFAWGVPLIITAIGASIWHDEYGNEESCVVRGTPFFATVLVPALATILFNIVSLILITLSLRRTTDKYSAHSLSPLERIRIVVAFIILFGLTWSFGILVISNDEIVFQYLFCILSGLQGLYIFLFYCVRNKKIRKFCHGILKGRSVDEMRRSSTRKRQLKRPRGETVESFQSFDDVKDAKKSTSPTNLRVMK